LIDHSERAVELFMRGYNCSQSVFASFCGDLNMDFEAALRMSSSFGAGMGRLREVCGAVTAMFMIAGIKYGYTDAADTEAKTEHYKLIQSLAEKFKSENKSIICRDLLGLAPGPDSPIPEARTADYYNNRPCAKIIGFTAKMIEELIIDRKKSSEQADSSVSYDDS